MRTAKTQTAACPVCGIAVEQSYTGRPKRFCGDECRNLWWKKHPDEINRQVFYHLTCANCGEKFYSYSQKDRKYCSHKCYIEDRYGRKPTEKISAMTRDEKVVWALRRRNNGSSCREIAEELGIPVNTAKAWMHRYRDGVPMDQKNSRTENQSVQVSEFEPEAIEICELPEAVMCRIFLICAVTRFSGKYDNFAAQVPGMFEYNLQTGDMFVFCNKTRHQLSVLQWQGDGFVLMFRRCEQERYPWPRFFEPKAVEITQSDLEMLIEYPRFMRRLRGLATPDFLT